MKVRFDLFFEADTKDFPKLLSEIASAIRMGLIYRSSCNSCADNYACCPDYLCEGVNGIRNERTTPACNTQEELYNCKHCVADAQNDVWTSKVISQLMDELKGQVESALVAHTDKTEKGQA